jgi:subtilase family serine protease
VSLTGAGQVAGLFEMDGYYANDITAYEVLAGLPSVTLTNVLVDGFAGNPVNPDYVVEVSLDIEMVIDMAPGLASLMVYEAPLDPTTPYDELNRIATDNLAKQISSSWLITIIVNTPIPDQVYEEFGAQGQSFFQCSGDYGAFYPGVFQWSDDPYITIVGGTTLTTRKAGGPWTAETTWTPYSGGGVSSNYMDNYSIPSYQVGIDMTANGGSTTLRNIPDVALTADNIWVIADNGESGPVGGTSCATPLWAGFTALINEQATANTQPLAGFLNPALYSLGKGPNAALYFHDITTGNNTNSGSPSYYYAVAGYDLCTGWGTPTGTNLINSLAPLGLQIPPATGFSSSGPFGGPFSPNSQTYALTNAGAGSVTWSLVITSSWLSASSTSGTVVAGAHATNVTISLNSVANLLAVGTYSGTVLFTNLTTHGAQTR